jgi:uncharacterized protein YecT (DUF1311 family)
MIINNRATRKILATLLLCLGIGSYSYAQSSYEAVLEKIDSKHQDCLDEGENMIACSGEYYVAIDSLMGVVYKEVLKLAETKEKTELRTEQREWLSNKNIKFREIEAAAKEEGNGSMNRMEALENKGAHIRERLDDLINRLK